MIGKAQKAQSYCLKNGIHIYPSPQEDGSFKIVISIKGRKPVIDPKEYRKDQWAKQIWSYYLYYYKKSLENVVPNKNTNES